MPNDPRVKFHKGGKVCKKDIEYLRKHPECIGFRYVGNGIGDGGRLGSIFEDGTPPDEGGGGGTGGGGGGGGGGGFTPAEAIPQLTPRGFNPGEISGITIGSIAAAAALTELGRRALEEERRRRGMQPVSQNDRPIRARRGGSILERSRFGTNAISRGINTAVQSFEMTPTRPAAPIQAEFAPLSVESSPSSSGASTPSGELTSFRPGPRGFQQQPSALAPAPTPAPAPARANVPLNLEQQLEMRQIEIRNLNISEARMKTLQSEITVLEEQIRASGGTVTSLEDRIRSAMNRPITDLERSEFGRGSWELQGRSLIPPATPEEQLRFDLLNQENRRTPPDTPEALSSGQRTPPEMAAARDRLDAMANRDAEITLALANTEISPEIRAQLREEQIKLNKEFKSLENMGEGTAAAKIEEQKLTAAFEAAQSKAGLKALKNTQSKLQKAKETSISKTITERRPIANNPANDSINAARPTRETSGTEMTSVAAHEQRQQTAIETIVESSTSASAGSAAAIERESLISPGGSSNVEVKSRGPTLMERGIAGGKAALQRATSRTPSTPVVKVEPIPKPPPVSAAGRAALERARAQSGLSTDVELSRLTQQPVETTGKFTSTMTPKEYSESRNQAELTAGKAALERSKARLSGLEKGTPLQPQETASGAAPRTAKGTPLQPQETASGAAPRTAPVERPAPERPTPTAPIEAEPTPPSRSAPVERPTPQPYEISGIETPSSSSSGTTTPAEIERPAPVERAVPVERPAATLVEELTYLETLYKSMATTYAAEGRALPEVPATTLAKYGQGEIEWRSKTWVVNKVLRDPKNSEKTFQFESGEQLSMKEMADDLRTRFENIAEFREGLGGESVDSKLQSVSQTLAETEKPSKITFGKRKGPKPEQKKSLVKKGTASAAMERQITPASGTAARPSEVRAAASAEARTTAPTERAAPAEMRTAPEAMSARSVLAPEVSARVPLLTAPEPRGPNVRAAVRRLEGIPQETTPSAEPVEEPLQPVEERIPLTPEEKAARLETIRESQRTSAAAQETINRQTAALQETTSGAAPRGRPVIEPTGMPGPSPPPSAPGTGTSTPREGVIAERTAGQQASFAEEVSAGLAKKPGRQKARITNGKTKTTVNPLERFVSPQFRNAPNVEIHPGSKTLMSSLSELGSRVPRLVPTRQVLLNAGHTALAEGGGAAAGFFAGSYAGQKMNEYFATHPPKNRGDEFGQALATSMVALGVGNLVSKVVTYVIKQGARVAIGAAITGSIDSAATAGGTAILEAALFATVATTAQYFTTKSLEDAGYSHEYSRSQGSLAATSALIDLEVAAWLLKGGPLNLYADASFIVSELFIIGFGIWSYFEELKEGAEEDRLEAEQREQIAAERAQEIKERNDSIARINRTNDLRSAFMIGLETHDYNFDAMFDTLTEQQKLEMGITTPESKAAFQRQVESAFDPLGMFAEPPSGLVVPEVLTPLEQQRRDVFNSYINWYIGELRGETQPPFNFDDPKVQELNEYSGGTWQSAAAVSATTSHMQSERVHPLILNAQNTIIDAFHNERKTIEDMPDDVVAYANLDSNFRASYEAYIIADAAAQILIEFNNTQHGYNDVDPALLAIADRDPSFRAAADAYYQTLANQARDFNLPISKIVELNALMENEQAIEVGKLNDARNAIIQKNMAENQAAIDSYNANIIRSINIYGDNFEAIIRNINEQSLLSGHTFLYASNKADLYRQLHLEMPELELIDPDDEIKDNALWKPGKGRKVGDTALYGFRHKLTDEQNQELEDMIASGKISRQDEVYQAALIRERDRHLYVETDQERADDLGMSLTDYHAKYGITIDIYDMEIIDYKLNSNPPENGRIRMPDGSIRTYRDGELVNIQSAPAPTIVAYDPALAQQPDGEITMPDGSVRTYKNGLVTEVLYSALTPPGQRLSPAEINAQIDATRGPSYAQLKTLYPEAYQRLQLKYAGDPDADAKIEATLTRGHKEGLYYPGGATREDGDPIPEPTEPVTPPQPVSTVLFNGEREMPDGTTRSYKDGKVISIGYPAGFPVKNMLDAKGIKALNNSEGIYYDPTPVTPVTPVMPTEPLKNGIVNMPDGSIRTYQNGLVVYVDYPGKTGKTPKQINEEEGVRNATYTARETTPTTPVAPTAPLQQGLVKMPNGSKRVYIDGKVVSVAYPEGVTGPTINEINATEGIKKVEPDSNNPVNPTAPVDPGGLPSQIQTPTQPDREPTYEELQVMYPTKYQTYTRSYADAGKYNIEVPSPEEQAMMIEKLLRAEHTDRTQAGTAAPLPPPTTTPTPPTNQPLPMVPGAKSYEYADSGTQVAPAPAPAPSSGAGPVDYRPRQQEPMQINNL